MSHAHEAAGCRESHSRGGAAPSLLSSQRPSGAARPALVAMERAAVLRVKRKRGGSAPAEALLLACKRLRTESEVADAAAGGDGVEKNLFKLVATVASQVRRTCRFGSDPHLLCLLCKLGLPTSR